MAAALRAVVLPSPAPKRLQRVDANLRSESSRTDPKFCSASRAIIEDAIQLVPLMTALAVTSWAVVMRLVKRRLFLGDTLRLLLSERLLHILDTCLHRPAPSRGTHAGHRSAPILSDGAGTRRCRKLVLPEAPYCRPAPEFLDRDLFSGCCVAAQRCLNIASTLGRDPLNALAGHPNVLDSMSARGRELADDHVRVAGGAGGLIVVFGGRGSGHSATARCTDAPRRPPPCGALERPGRASGHRRGAIGRAGGEARSSDTTRRSSRRRQILATESRNSRAE